MREKRSNKSTVVQATILGRVERLSGNRIGSNPYPKGSDLWSAFRDGWNRLLNDPLVESLRKNKEAPELY